MKTKLHPYSFVLFLSLITLQNLFSQDVKKDTTALTYKDVQSRSRDHLMLQFGYMNWQNKPDSIYIAGFNRQFKIAGMYDFLIKGFPNLSFGIGPGFAWDNIYFNDTKPNISQTSGNTAQLSNHANQDHYQKSKLTTFYVDLLGELRFASNIRNYNRGFKMAIGLSYGFLLQSYTKGVTLLSGSGATLNAAKEITIDSRYFNSSRVLTTVKIGWGFFHLYGSYQLDQLFKSGVGPAVQPFSFGVGLSGL